MWDDIALVAGQLCMPFCSLRGNSSNHLPNSFVKTVFLTYAIDGSFPTEKLTFLC